MKISIINGSPKAGRSNSEILGNYLLSLLKDNEIRKYYSISVRLDDKIKSCMGCFECWIKTPGKCKIKDGYENLAKLYSKADKVVIISQCVYGSYSPFVKNVLDRTIPYLLPFFKFKNKEMHHITRNKTKFDLNVYFYGKNLSPNEKTIAKEIVKANSVNLDVKNFKVSFLEN